MQKLNNFVSPTPVRTNGSDSDPDYNYDIIRCSTELAIINYALYGVTCIQTHDSNRAPAQLFPFMGAIVPPYLDQGVPILIAACMQDNFTFR